MKSRGASVRVSVPGKVMLAGEYSVLTGSHALAVTVDRHLTVRARPLKVGEGIQVGSSHWDEPRKATAGMAATGEPLVDAAAHGAALFGLSDLAIRVDSELDLAHGLGSSSALRLGTLLAIEELARLKAGAPVKRPKSELWQTARAALQLQRSAQNAASGYDIATQLIGGLVHFCGGGDDATWPREATPVGADATKALPAFVHVYVGGRGAPTTKTMGSTRDWLNAERRTVLLESANHALLARLTDAAREPHDKALVHAVVKATGTQRRLLEDAPSFPKKVAAALAHVGGLDDAWSYKTTGAGGEDALLVTGSLHEVDGPARALRRIGWHRLEAGFETLGVRIEREKAGG